MVTNKFDSRLQKRTEAIDNLLRDRDESVKAHVLEYIVKYDIDPENEFFIIFAALGTVEAFLKKSPQEMQDVFNGFNQEISQWSEANLETLNHLSQKARLTEKLARNSETLGNSLIEFLKVCERLIDQLRISNGLQTTSLSQLQNSEIELRGLMTQIEKKIFQLNNSISQVNSDIENWKNPHFRQMKRWTWKDNILSSTLMLGIFLSISQYFNYQNIRDTNQKVQWILEKANRQDCLSGIKNADSVECQSF